MARPRKPAPAPPQRHPAPPDLVLLALLLGALGLRLWLWSRREGPLWLEEDLPHELALGLWDFREGRPTPDPHYPLWPHLSVYVFFLVQALRYLLGRLTGTYSGLADFRAAVQLEPESLRGTAMLAQAALGVAVVAAAAAVARRWAGRQAAWLVAGVLALDPNFVRHSLIVSPDMALTLFVLLGLLAARDVQERGRGADSARAGLWAGLGAACKYSPALLALPIALAHLGGGKHPRRAAPVRGLATAAGAALGAFVLTSPFTLRDLVQRSDRVRDAVGAVTGGHFGAERAPGLVTHATVFLPGELGWPLLVLAAAGTLWAVLRRAREHALLLAFLLPYAAIFAALPTAFERYLLPAVPLALVLAAAAAVEAWRRPWMRGVIVVTLVIAAGGLVQRTAILLRDYARPDTRTLARAWLLDHARDRDLVTTEHLGPALPNRAAYDVLAAAPGISPRRAERLRRGPAYWIGVIPLTLEAPDSTTPYYDLRLALGLDWVVVNDGVRARFLADTARFPVHREFYRALERGFVTAYRSPTAGVVGPTVRIYRPPAAGQDSLEAEWERFARHQPLLVSAWPHERLAQVFAARAQLRAQGGRYAEAAATWRRALREGRATAAWQRLYAASLEAAGDSTAARAAERRADEIEREGTR